MEVSIANGIPVNSLYPDRYGVKKSKLYEILKLLRIDTFRDGKTACITIEQLRILDGYFKELEKSQADADRYAESYALVSTENSTLAPATPDSLWALLTLPPLKQVGFLVR